VPDSPPDDKGPAPGERDPRSELDEGLAKLTHVVGGVLTRLLGEKVTRIPIDPDRPTVSPEADRAIEHAGERVGRFLHAVGQGLKAHPDDPAAAWEDVRNPPHEPHPGEGETALTEGVRVLASGILKTTEKAIDKVAPRAAPRPTADHGEE
jgi:hypothetical protein